MRLNRTLSTQFVTFRFFSFITIFLLSLVAHANEATSNQDNIHIRTLAASCAACHGTLGNSHSTTPVLAGLDATYFETRMLAFKNGRRDSTVMHHHAKGLTDDEIKQLSQYFSQQKRVTTQTLTPQKLKVSHE